MFSLTLQLNFENISLLLPNRILVFFSSKLFWKTQMTCCFWIRDCFGKDLVVPNIQCSEIQLACSNQNHNKKSNKILKDKIWGLGARTVIFRMQRILDLGFPFFEFCTWKGCTAQMVAIQTIPAQKQWQQFIYQCTSLLQMCLLSFRAGTKHGKLCLILDIIFQ